MILLATLERLTASLGREAVEEHERLDIDGAEPTVTIRPADGEALARALGELSACGLAALVKGGGNRLGLGNLLNRGEVLLSSQRLRGVDELDTDNGVCHVRAGTPLSEVRAAARAGGWELPLDAPGAGATAGGVVAAAAVGPRAQGFGLPRNLVLGLEVALASGERTRCGGRVVKNVSGYDLNKLYTGSLGTLGVIEGAWLRLCPIPERTLVLEAAGSSLDGVCERGLAAARRPTARAAAIAASARTPTGRDVRLVVELAGDARNVEYDAAWLEQHCGARPAEGGALDQVRALQAACPGPSGLRFRIDALPSSLEPALAQLCGSSATVLAYPGLGLLYAEVALEGERQPEAVDAAFRRAARTARAAGGGFVCEAAPAWAKRGRDVFGEEPAALPLMGALKRSFDPGGVLNPGRFAGRI
jgi:glycolate oxidase FAD binding subunit